MKVIEASLIGVCLCDAGCRLTYSFALGVVTVVPSVRSFLPFVWLVGGTGNFSSLASALAADLVTRATRR